MSRGVLITAWGRDLPARHKLVLLALADEADHLGLGCLNVDEIMVRCGCTSRRQIQGIIRSLDRAGVLVAVKGGPYGGPFIYGVTAGSV